jgi:AAA domain, putative AbiEii toxin, Type IV TA system
MGSEDQGASGPVVSSPARLLLDELSFSGGETVQIPKNAVVVIVGPNNSGKTQALLGIAQSIENAAHQPMVCKATIVGMGSQTDLAARLEPYRRTVNGNDHYTGPYFDFGRGVLGRWGPKPTKLNELSKYFSVLLDTGSRLARCGPGPAHRVGVERPNDAFQLLYEDPDLEAKVSKIFREVFGADLIINSRAGAEIPLHVGERPKLATGEKEHSKSYIEKIAQLPRLNQQGDGMRSFGALLLAVKVMPRDIILIDEPEAFLHPPQERRIGRLLAEEQPEACQIVVATHSEDIIQGVLSGDVGRVIIVRVTREGNLNHAKQLNNAEVVELWKSPILRYSNILSGLFHEAVVITEADADCRFYDSIASALPAREDRPPTSSTRTPAANNGCRR